MAQVVKNESESTGMVRRLDPQALIEQALTNNAGIETLERLVALAKDIRAEQAREAWNKAMAEFQRDAPQIIKRKKANFGASTGGSVRYSYAPLDAIAPRLQERMGPLGLSISWRQRIEKDAVAVSCRISHELGHFEESGEVLMPIDYEARTAASKAQRVGIALTYASRYALRSVSGIVAEDDDADGAEPEPEPRPMPRRASESQQAPPSAAEFANPWIGTVLNVTQRTGKKKDGSAWTLYIVKGSDGQEFKTFSETDAQFAKESGVSQVSISWDVDPQGGRKLLSIEPAI